jgi:hypothetical protein
VTTACHEPGNGKPTCIKSDDIEQVKVSDRETRTMLERHEKRDTEEFLTVFGALSRMEGKIDGVETKLDRLIEGVQIGKVTKAEPKLADELPTREPLTSLDYDEMSHTGVIRVTQVLEEENRRLRAEVLAAQTAVLAAQTSAAAATARFDERVRHSDRARAIEVRKSDVNIAKWKLIVWLLATVLTTGSVVTAALKLLFG